MMRNIPLSFLAEETLNEVARQHSVCREYSNPSSLKIKINSALAAKNAAAIQDHKWFLSERLGRDAGLPVAALDYLENIQRIAGSRPASLTQRVIAAIESALESDAMQGLAYSQRMMRGLPGSHRGEDFFPLSYNESGTDKIKSRRLFVKKTWADIQRHKWLLSERLGRDVGNNVAALDYSENLSPLTGSALDSLKSFAQRMWRNLVTSLDADGPKSIANLERMMRGTRF